MLKSLAEHYEFDVEAPWGTLNSSVPKKVVLYGSGKENIEFKYERSRRYLGAPPSVRSVLHNMERRYKETESSAVREELAKFISNRPCTSCEGTRLSAARHVFVENTRCRPSRI